MEEKNIGFFFYKQNRSDIKYLWPLEYSKNIACP